MKYTIINAAGDVVNIVAVDSVEDVHVPDGHTALPADVGAEIGGTHNGTSFVPMDRPAEPTPTIISKLQLVRALRAAGHWGGAKAALAQADLIIKEDWDFAYQINRSEPLMQTFADALELTPADVDNLFIAGSTL